MNQREFSRPPDSARKEHACVRLPDSARDQAPWVATRGFSLTSSITSEPIKFESSPFATPRGPSSAPSAVQEAPRTLPSRSSQILARVRSAGRPPLHLKGAVKILKRTTSLYPVDLKDVWEGIWTAPNNEDFHVSIISLSSNCLDTDDEVGQKQMKQHIEREAVIWEVADHENFAPLLGYYQTANKTPQLVYPFFKNGSLSSYINGHPGFGSGLTYIERLKLVLSLARSLGNLHSREPPIVYGNLKPANIMVDDDVKCVLRDFGNSRVITPSDSPSDFSADSTLGTVAYLAMELLQENALPTLASDVYAFGGLTLFIMTGKAPFYNISGGAGPIIVAITRGKIPIPSDYPMLAQDDPLWSLMQKCWDSEPDRRPPMSQIIYKINLIVTCGSGLTGPVHSDTPTISVVQPGAPIDFFPPELPGILIEGRCIWDGYFGIVYRGTWTAPSKQPVPVAIKRIKQIRGSEYNEEEQRTIWAARIKRETVIWKAAEHPNVLAFHGYQMMDGQPSLISPWCKNGDLWSYLRKHPEMTDIQKLEILVGAARGLGHLHSLEPPICHGDVKPQNVMIGDKMEALLSDFGISRVMTNLLRTGMTTAGGVTGTPGFLAKELSEGSKPTDKSDVYAFGGLILATMTEKAPFYKQFPNEPAIAVLIFRGKTPDPDDYPKLPKSHNLWDLMRKCWNSEPNNRPSMIQITAELGAEIDRLSAVEDS